MKIAITGGAGFIGSKLAEMLAAAGHELIIIDLKRSEQFPEVSHIINVTDEAALTKALKGVDVIYNLAAEHRDDVRPIQKYYDVNVGGAKALVAAAKANNIKTIIFTSTVAVYGLDAGESRESDTPAPFNDYGKSKLQAEEVFNAWQTKTPDSTLVAMRLVATFGPGNRGNVYTLMNQIERGKFVMVGNGRNKKSVAYLDNVAGFLQHCLSLKQGAHLYNYADKPDLNMRDMVRDIRAALGLDGLGPRVPYIIGLSGGMTFDVAAKLTGKTFPISAIRVKKFCANTVVNADKLAQTGYKAPHTLSEGIKIMMEHEFPQTQKAA